MKCGELHIISKWKMKIGIAILWRFDCRLVIILKCGFDLTGALWSAFVKDCPIITNLFILSLISKDQNNIHFRIKLNLKCYNRINSKSVNKSVWIWIFDITKNKTLHSFYDCIRLDLQIDYFRVQQTQVFGRTEIENCAGKKRKLLNLILVVVVHLLLNGDHGASRMCQNYHLWFTSLSSWLRPAQSLRTRRFWSVLEFHVLQIRKLQLKLSSFCMMACRNANAR